MDIGGMLGHRAGDQLVDETHHRRLAGQIAQAIDIDLRGGLGIRAILRRGAGRAGVGAQPRDRGLQLRGDGDLDHDAPAGGKRDRLDGEAVVGIGHGDDDLGLVRLDGQDHRLAHETCAQSVDEHGLLGQFLPRQQRQARDLGGGLGEIALRDDAELGQDVGEAAVGRCRCPAGALQAPLVQLAPLHEIAGQPALDRGPDGLGRGGVCGDQA